MPFLPCRSLQKLLCLAAALCSCAPEFDTVRPALPQSSVGSQVYEEVCNRISRTAYPDDVSGARTRNICSTGTRPPAGAPMRLQALHAERQRFIAAIDTAFADPVGTPRTPLVQDAKAYLTQFLPLFDNGLMQQQMAAVGELLHSLVHTPGSVAALERLGLRQGYDAEPATGGTHLHTTQLLPALFSAASLGDVLQSLGRALGPGGSGAAAYAQLLAVAHQQLMVQPGSLLITDHQAFAPLRTFLLATNPAVVPQYAPRCIVARDARGVALPTAQPAAGVAQVASLTDLDGDGLADINHSGEFIDAHGRVLALPTPFGRPHAPGRDAMGRAVAEDGNLLFVYRDVGDTNLAGLLAQLRQGLRIAPDALYVAAQALDTLLGPKQQVSLIDPHAATPVLATTHHTAAAPLTTLLTTAAYALSAPLPGAAAPQQKGRQLDAAYAPQQKGRQLDAAQALLHLGQALGEQHPTALASMAQLVADAAALPTGAAQLAPNSLLTADLLNIGVQIVQQDGLLEALVAAMAQPQTQALGPTLAKHLRFTDAIDYNVDDLNGPPLGTFHTPVNPNLPPTGHNASVMQRLLNLVHDTRQSLCNPPFAFDSKAYARCEMFRIDDAAKFYLQAIAGTAHLTLRFAPDDFPMRMMLEELKDNGSSAVLGFDHARPLPPQALTETDRLACHGEAAPGEPYDCVTLELTPEAAGRMLFAVYDARLGDEVLGGTIGLMRLITEDMQVAGQSIGKAHPGTLFAWEKENFFSQVKPLVAAFAHVHREDLLLDMLEVLQRHWAPPPAAACLAATPGSAAAAAACQASAAAGAAPSGANLVAFAPQVAELLDGHAALAKLHQLAVALQSVEVDGRSGAQVLQQALQALAQPADAALQALLGPDAVWPAPLTPPTYLHVLLHAAQALAADIAAAPGAADAPGVDPQTLTKLAQMAFSTEQTASGRRFTNSHLEALAVAALPALAEQWQDLVTANCADSAPLQRATRLRDGLLKLGADPIVAQGLTLVEVLAKDRASKVALSALTSELLDNHLDAAVGATATFMQMLGDADDLVPLLRAMAPLFTPQTGLLAVGMQVMQHACQHDTQQVLPRVVAGLHRDIVSDHKVETPVQALLDIYARVNRLNPEHRTPLRVADYQTVLPGLHSFMLDDQHGFVRLVHLVGNRVSRAP
jgi:hypothetical protein